MINNFSDLSRQKLMELASLYESTGQRFDQATEGLGQSVKDQIGKLINADVVSLAREGLRPHSEITDEAVAAVIAERQAAEQRGVQHTNASQSMPMPAAPASPPAQEAAPVVASKPLSLAERARRRQAQRGQLAVVNPQDFVAIEPDWFLPYLFEPESHANPVGIRVQLKQTESEDGVASCLLWWQKLTVPDGQEVIYRVFGSDSVTTLSPDNSTQLVVTTGNAYEETLSGESGVRHYMVWAYTSDNPDLLTEVQPRLIGEELVVLPPTNFSLVDQNGRVEGKWESLDGHVRTRVYAKAETDPGKITDPQFELVQGVEQRTFSHQVPIRGRTYSFQAFAVAKFRDKEVMGQIGTPKISRNIDAEIERIQLLGAERIIQSAGDDMIMASWAAPDTGSVKLYLTEAPPRPELQRQTVDLVWIDEDDALGSTEWIIEDESEAETTVARTVTWPNEWSKVYCVPVHVVGEQAMVGEFKVLHRVSPIQDYRLIERVSGTLITFDWPQGATFVEIKRENGEIQELQLEDYQRQGGVRLNLERSGEKLYLTPKSIYSGKYTLAEPTLIEYPGLKVYSYDIKLVDGIHYLVIWCDGAVDPNPPKFTLVYNPLRLPLHERDGEPVQTRLYQGTQPGITGTIIQPTQLSSSRDTAVSNGVGWAINAEALGGRGFWRLFLINEEDRWKTAQRKIIVEREVVRRLFLDGGR